MRIAILSDVHANLEALEAVASDLERARVEKVVFLGDAVGYGADPNACVKQLAHLCDICLLGNHDYVAMGLESPRYFNIMAQQSIIWTQKILERSAIKRLSDFSLDATLLDYYFVHATPEKPLEWNYLLTPDDAARNFGAVAQNFCFIGHSHLPSVFCRRPDETIATFHESEFTAEPGCRYLINVGSVGQPRDGIREACYLIAETDCHHFVYHRVNYDLARAQEKMKKAHLPEFLIARLAGGK